LSLPPLPDLGFCFFILSVGSEDAIDEDKEDDDSDVDV